MKRKKESDKITGGFSAPFPIMDRSIRQKYQQITLTWITVDLNNTIENEDLTYYTEFKLHK